MTSRPASTAVYCLTFGLLLHAPLITCATQAQDAGVEKALSGLPQEVLEHIQLAPPTISVAHLTAEDPLAVSIYLSHKISGDEDVKNRVQYECGLQALRQGRNATARELASQMTDYRAALLLLNIAEKETSKDREHSLKLMEAAAGMVRLVKPWQADLVLSHLCRVATLLEQDEAMILNWWQSINDEETKRMASIGALSVNAQKTGVFDLAALKAERAKYGATKPMPGLLDISRNLFDLALSKVTSEDPAERGRAANLVNAATEILKISNVVRAELLVDAAADFWKAGDQETSRKLFELAEAGFGAPHEQMARLNYKLVYLWSLRSKADVLKPVIEKAEKQARELEQMYRPFAYSWLAESWLLIGDKEHSNDLLNEAEIDAVSNVNPRTALVGMIEICLCHAYTGKHLPEKAMASAKRMASGQAQ
jgi:hypothetical protein